MDARTAHLLLEVLDLGRADLPPEQAAAIEDHLRTHQGGEQLLRDARHFDDRMRREMIDVPVPAGLHDQILNRLSKHRAVRVRRRLWQGMTIAASLLILTMIGLNLPHWFRPGIDTQSIARQYESQSNPAQAFRAAESWLEAQELAFHPSVPFDPNRLAAYEMVEFQGRTVPMLLFVNHEQGVMARVYLVPSTKFNLDMDRITTEAQQSFCSVRVLADKQRPDELAYVVVFTGHSLDPFRPDGRMT